MNDNDVYIIDTGMDDYAELQITIAKSLGNPKVIFLTHGHLDYINSAKRISEALKIPIFTHKNELPTENIKSGQIIDNLCPKLITTSHGDDLYYSDDIYSIYKFKYEE